MSIMAKIKTLSRYETLQHHSQKRREFIQKAQHRHDAMRNAVISNISATATNQMVLTEQIVRTRSEAALKAKMAALDKYV
jgi:hypothetical protein